jgi:general secretion pathway protein G
MNTQHNNRRLTTHRRTPRAFSLMEMLFVIAIIALLAALIIPNLGNVFGGAQRDTARAQVVQLKNAVEAFRRDMGRLPTEEEGLSVLVDMPEDGEGKWQGYLDRRTVPTDPWGTPYQYERLTDDPQFDFTVISYGADTEPGGEGDAADINARD